MSDKDNELIIVNMEDQKDDEDNYEVCKRPDGTPVTSSEKDDGV